jgi:hypothetical protein
VTAGEIGSSDFSTLRAGKEGKWKKIMAELSPRPRQRYT